MAKIGKKVRPSAHWSDWGHLAQDREKWRIKKEANIQQIQADQQQYNNKNVPITCEENGTGLPLSISNFSFALLRSSGGRKKYCYECEISYPNSKAACAPILLILGTPPNRGLVLERLQFVVAVFRTHEHCALVPLNKHDLWRYLYEVAWIGSPR